MHVRADERAFVTGGADKDVKFWEFERKDATEESVSSFLRGVCTLFIFSVGSKRKIAFPSPHPHAQDV